MLEDEGSKFSSRKGKICGPAQMLVGSYLWVRCSGNEYDRPPPCSAQVIHRCVSHVLMARNIIRSLYCVCQWLAPTDDVFQREARVEF